jgi:hypothetical protein
MVLFGNGVLLFDGSRMVREKIPCRSCAVGTTKLLTELGR